MVICHCLAVNDRAITELVADKVATVDDVVELCGAGSRCGGCRESIEWILSVAQQSTVGVVAVPSPA